MTATGRGTVTDRVVRRSLRRYVPAIRNVAAGYLGTAADAVVFLLLTPFLVRHLGLTSYGIWGIGVALSEWLLLLDLGLREAVVKFVSAHQARSEEPEVRRLADTALFLYCVAGAVALALVGTLAWLGVPQFVSTPEALASLRWVVLLMGFSAAVSLPAGVTGVLLEGLGRFDLINLFRMIHAVLRLVLVVMALQIGLGLPGVAGAELLARLVIHVVRWVAVHRIEAGVVPRPRHHAPERRRLLGFGVWSAVRQVSELLILKSYEPILATMSGLASVGAFFAGRRLATVSAEAVVPMAGVLFPLSSEMEAAGRTVALRETLVQTTKVAFLVALPICLVLGIGADAVQANWLGGRAPEAVPVMEVFSVVFLLVAVALPAECILMGLGHARILALAGLVQGGLTLSIGVALVPTLGPVGLAFGALTGVLGVQLVVQLPLAARSCGLSLRQLIRRAVLPPLAAGAPAGLGLFLLHDLVAPGGLAALGAWATGGLLVYALLLWWVAFDAEAKTYVRTHLGRLLDPGPPSA